MMITSVARCKIRCGIGGADVTQDDLLTFLIGDVTRRFEQWLGRSLHRTVGCKDEFAASETKLLVRTPPIEEVTAWETKETEAGGWAALATAPDYILWADKTIVLLKEPQGSYMELLRVTYNGGYVFQDEVPGVGEVALPAWYEEAAVTQVAHLWQLRDKINVTRVDASTGIQWSIADVELVPNVRSELAQKRRSTYLGHS